MKPSLCLSLSRTGIPMKRRSKARSVAKSLLGSGFKAKRSLLGSGFKAKGSLLGSGFKAKKSLPGSGSGSESGSSHRMNPAQPQKLRDEKKQVKAVQDSPRPHCLAKQGEEKAANPYCECCCGAAGSHYKVTCPYLTWLPWNVDTVGKGFVIMCQLCSAIGDDCWHQRKRAVPLICGACGVKGHHLNGACSEKNGMEYGRKITLGRRPDPSLRGQWISSFR